MSTRTLYLADWRIRRRIEQYVEATGEWTAVVGAAATGWLSATKGGPAIAPTLSVALSDFATPGVYSATLQGHILRPLLTAYIGKTIWECVKAGAEGDYEDTAPLYVSDRPVV